ncbi:MAG: hypothetical protein ACXVC1_02435, partial [Tumebacillaceae bacterium]
APLEDRHLQNRQEAWANAVPVHSLRTYHVEVTDHHNKRGMYTMYGVFGGYTQWAVVFLIIFVLFFLLVPGMGMGYGAVGAQTGGHC